MKKKLAVCVLACMTAAALAACSGGSKSGAQEPAQGAQAQDAAAGSGQDLSKADGANAADGAAGANTANASKVYQIGFTTAAVEDDPYFVFAKNFSDIVAEKTGGDIRIDVMGGGQLGQEGEMFSGMQMGTTDMAVMTNAYASGYVPASGVFDLPFIFKDNDTAAEILDSELGQKVLKEYDNYGVKALGWGEGGFRHLVTLNQAVRKPEDMKGLKIRCMETETYLATYAALGVNAVPMAWSETITGLQQGTIDGLDIPISVTYSNGFPDIAKYLNMTGHFYSPLLICTSKDLYDSLSPEEQTILAEAAVEAGKLCRENNKRVEEQMLSEMESQGMTVVRDVDLDAFRGVLGDFYNSRKEAVGGTYVEDLLKALEQ